MILQLAAAVGLRMLLAGSSPAAPRVYLAAGPGPFAPDQVVEVRWEGLPADAGECELLLDLDGGRARLRITDELDPRAGSFRWLVPNLSARGARLVLRMNRGGGEVEIAPSALFQIGISDDAPRAALILRAGEVWLADPDAGDADTPEPASTLAGSPVTIRSGQPSILLALPERPALRDPAASERRTEPADLFARTRPLPDDHPRLLAYPRRI